MNERMQRAWDGELTREELDADEAAELAETEALVEAVLRAVPTEPLPDLSPAVLQRIEAITLKPTPATALRTRRARGLLDWLWTPRPISIGWRPVYGFALALAVLLGVGQTVFALRGKSAQLPIPQLLIQFRLNAPQANHVALAGEFTNWKPAYALTRSQAGVWTVVVPLEPGVHDYGFVIDGERWVPDPNAPAVDDGFGGVNSRLALLAPVSKGL